MVGVTKDGERIRLFSKTKFPEGFKEAFDAFAEKENAEWKKREAQRNPGVKGVTVTGAGSADANGRYEAKGTAGGKQSFAAAAGKGGAREGMMMCFNPDKKQWEIMDPVMLETLYVAAFEGPTPPKSNWKVAEGDSPCPTLTLE
mmetsp:Transcript_12029/g.24164  ORF Transcript_12029/g.24164 Transcript_12029/m.24164 type:complete len:144 (+) Transcript_12029:465-896(+)